MSEIHCTERGVVFKSLDFLGYPKYRVGSDGSLWSFHRRKCWKKSRPTEWTKLRLGTDSDGYHNCGLSKEGKTKTFKVHRLVLLAFIGPCPDGYDSRHYPDQTKTNNRLENLSWATKPSNMADKKENGTYLRGETNGLAKFSNQDGRKMIRFWKSGRYTQQQIADKFRVCKITVFNVLHGYRYVGLGDTRRR